MKNHTMRSLTFFRGERQVNALTTYAATGLHRIATGPFTIIMNSHGNKKMDGLVTSAIHFC